ncbi:hypothetical protein OAF42_00455 [Planctomicrobium sp.]|nr:hypothetical protein [Planctomicrobium sp.]MDB4732889.1 hypothetical protein [Planctomicrobium sp.]
MFEDGTTPGTESTNQPPGQGDCDESIGAREEKTDTICVSNGTEFYEISAADLPNAIEDGFYVPEERGLHIVGNGEEIFEIHADDLADAQTDGFSIVGTKLNATSVTNSELNSKNDSLHAELTDSIASPSEAAPQEVFSDETFHIDAAPTENELRHAELLAAFNAAESKKEKLWLGWQLYGPTREGMRKRASTFGMSAIMHVVLLLMLGLIVFTVQREEVSEIVSTISEIESPDDALDTEISVDDSSDSETEEQAASEEDQAAALLAATTPSTAIMPTDLETLDFQTLETLTGGEVQGLSRLTGSAKAARGAATAKYGGSPGSEEAVETGLDWLSRHQAEDGSWCFNHTVSVECDCKSAGTHNGKTGATGLALLCYYGAGYTFAEGDYSATISRGIQYLLKSMDRSSGIYGDFREAGSAGGGIYQHGIATAALCETLSVNLALIQMKLKDNELRLVDSEGRVLTTNALKINSRTLRRACDLALIYMYHHQSPTTGGWGYEPQSAGDLSVTGWQVMAMASGENASVKIPPNVKGGVRKYLTDASKDGGSTFAYTPDRAPTPTMNAVGLMCSLLNGADRSKPGIQSGVNKINVVGPSFTEMYYTYYATQVLFGWGDESGPEGKKHWTEWNRRLRDPLVALQIKEGHEKGSWPSGTSPTTGPGGRHLETCLAIMTLEIYYRKLPMLERLSMDPVDLTDVKKSDL